MVVIMPFAKPKQVGLVAVLLTVNEAGEVTVTNVVLTHAEDPDSFT